MNATLLKALIVLAPLCILFYWSLTLFFRSKKRLFSFLQLFGAGCLVLVALVHICEAIHLFPFMQWGSPHSIGHYLDLSSAILGLTLFPIGFLLQMFKKRQA